MNIIKKLKLEIDGIVGIVQEYDSDAYIQNITDKLKLAVDENKLDEIQYFINKLDKWYSDNQREIQSNEYVFNKEIHIEIEKNIKEYARKINELMENNSDKLNVEELGDNIIMDKKKVFIVHGHDELAVEQASNFVKALELEPIILHEQPSSGKTIIEKIEKYSNVGFGIVLYTPCDIGASKEETNNLQGRARQNVVFEHGYLIGKLGREHVCALVKGHVEKPNDISGVVYITMDDRKAWRFEVVREMKKLGYNIDTNNLV